MQKSELNFHQHNCYLLYKLNFSCWIIRDENLRSKSQTKAQALRIAWNCTTEKKNMNSKTSYSAFFDGNYFCLNASLLNENLNQEI